MVVSKLPTAQTSFLATAETPKNDPLETAAGRDRGKAANAEPGPIETAAGTPISVATTHRALFQLIMVSTLYPPFPPHHLCDATSSDRTATPDRATAAWSYLLLLG